ncbi:non-specific lipid-transfer protein AP10-like [Lycium ferocissimum]|uniref:non-specific lipid-transfer protein AP10-like n=1 Tax=Lycium ferocissimum TaxID=112874 RepID=UPI0028152097|nr:non-specific lipid-transfer protein AP10-like [Lycium ferocissimum]
MARLFCAMIILLLVLATSAAPSCKIVSKGIVPCLYYIRGKHHPISEKPSTACCKGLNNIQSGVNNDEDRLAVCKCMESALSRIHYDPTRIGLAKLLCTHSSLASVGPKIRICPRIESITLKCGGLLAFHDTCVLTAQEIQGNMNVALDARNKA